MACQPIETATKSSKCLNRRIKAAQQMLYMTKSILLNFGQSRVNGAYQFIGKAVELQDC